MSRISKLFTGLCTAALFMIILAAPVKADLASDAAWVQAQAAAGLKSAQAALDAAYATGVKDAAWVQAQQAAGMAAGLAHQQDIANQAAAGLKSAQAAQMSTMVTCAMKAVLESMNTRMKMGAMENGSTYTLSRLCSIMSDTSTGNSVIMV